MYVGIQTTCYHAVMKILPDKFTFSVLLYFFAIFLLTFPFKSFLCLLNAWYNSLTSGCALFEGKWWNCLIYGTGRLLENKMYMNYDLSISMIYNVCDPFYRNRNKTLLCKTPNYGDMAENNFEVIFVNFEIFAKS